MDQSYLKQHTQQNDETAENNKSYLVAILHDLLIPSGHISSQPKNVCNKTTSKPDFTRHLRNTFTLPSTEFHEFKSPPVSSI